MSAALKVDLNCLSSPLGDCDGQFELAGAEEGGGGVSTTNIELYDKGDRFRLNSMVLFINGGKKTC